MNKFKKLIDLELEQEILSPKPKHKCAFATGGIYYKCSCGEVVEFTQSSKN